MKNKKKTEIYYKYINELEELKEILMIQYTVSMSKIVELYKLYYELLLIISNIHSNDDKIFPNKSNNLIEMQNARWCFYERFLFSQINMCTSYKAEA